MLKGYRCTTAVMFEETFVTEVSLPFTVDRCLCGVLKP